MNEEHAEKLKEGNMKTNHGDDGTHVACETYTLVEQFDEWGPKSALPKKNYGIGK